MNPPMRAICWWQCCSAQLKPPRDTSAPASLHTQVVALAEPPLRGWDAPRLKMGFPKGKPQCWQLLHMGCGTHCDLCEGMGPPRG